MKYVLVSFMVLVLLAIPTSASAYEVKTGDTWSSIAAEHGISVCTLMKANGLLCSVAWRTIPGPLSVITVPTSPAPIVKKRCMGHYGIYVCP